jgi:hypothetical protein
LRRRGVKGVEAIGVVIRIDMNKGGSVHLYVKLWAESVSGLKEIISLDTTRLSMNKDYQ